MGKVVICLVLVLVLSSCTTPLVEDDGIYQYIYIREEAEIIRKMELHRDMQDDISKILRCIQDMQDRQQLNEKPYWPYWY
ncbi:MAG: hypothetical protein KAS32_26815 [Candidatus Peribacteraceae bacterium]|nr:hypothetical protein [Candidatus Peribacteraceae bacterium]